MNSCEYREAHREQERERVRLWTEANYDRALQRSLAYRSTHKDEKREYDRLYREANRERRKAQDRAYYAQLRATIFRRYGEMCACCSSTERLTIDHPNGDGGEHRRTIGKSGKHFYQWLLSMYLPPGYQVLCFPCNQSKGTTPHCRLDHAAVM